MSEDSTLSLDALRAAPHGSPGFTRCTRSAAVEAFAKLRKLTISSTRRHFDSMSRQTGINGAMTSALWEIKRSPRLRICELADVMAIHQSTASNLVDKLIKKGLVERNASDSDRRVARFFLTAEGEKVVKRAPQPSRILMQDALMRLAPEALVSLNDLLDFLIRQLEEDASSMLSEEQIRDAA